MFWSLSKYGRYAKCPANFDFRYNKKVPDPAGPAAARGTGIHEAIASYLKTGEWTIPGLSDYAKKVAEQARAEGARDEVAFAFTKEWMPLPIPFDWRDPNLWVVGFVDGFNKIDTHGKAQEWKSGKVWDDHPLQRNLYLVMILSAHPELETAEITTHYTDLGYGIKDQMHRSLLEAEQKEWERRVTPMFNDTFYSPRPGKHCLWCPYSSRKGGPCSH